MYLGPLNCTLKNRMLNFILCIFYYNKKSQFLMIKKKEEDGVQVELDIVFTV